MIDPNAIVREAHAEAIPYVLNNIHTNARTSNDAEKGKLYIFCGRRLDLRLSLNSHCTADVKWDYANRKQGRTPGLTEFFEGQLVFTM